MKKQAGFTLIELMIALLIGLVIVSATIGIYISTIRGSMDVLRSARLNHDLDSAMQLMINDIRRAGYWGGAIAGANSQTNPFTGATTNVQIHDEGQCILYTYDANGSGINTLDNTADDVDANEFYGFRLNNNAVEMRLTGTTTAAEGCGQANQNWQALTINDNSGEEINITRVEYSFDPIVDPNLPGTSKCMNTVSLDNPPETLCIDTVDYLDSEERAIETRQINIVITGQLDNDDTVTKVVSNSVKIRSDRIFTQP